MSPPRRPRGRPWPALRPARGPQPRPALVGALQCPSASGAGRRPAPCPPLGDSLGEVGEHYGEGQPDGDRPGKNARVSDRLHERHHRADQDNEHHRVPHLHPGSNFATASSVARRGPCGRTGCSGALRRHQCRHYPDPAVNGDRFWRAGNAWHLEEPPVRQLLDDGPSDTAGKNVSAPTIKITPMRRP